MKFCLCHLVLLDDGNPFKDAYVSKCKSLKLNNDILSKRNHKELLVENFHHFKNKATTIAMENWQSDDVFVRAGIAAGYAQNNAHIDETDTLHSTIAMGREIRFPVDIDLSALPQLI